MIIHSSGYDLTFIQKRECKDATSHLFTLIYKFHSPVTRYNYIINADFHAEEVFIIKFYVQQHSKSDFKYSKLTNKGDLINILITNAKLVPVLLKEFPAASFGFIGARSIDSRSKKVEDYSKNQRFRIYRQFVSDVIGDKTFAHYEYESISGYLLINKSTADPVEKERAVVHMFSKTYQNLLDIGS